MDLLQSITTILALVAAILAWAAKLWWSKEYKEAKEAQIASLKEQLEQYKDITPTNKTAAAPPHLLIVHP